MGIDNNSYMIGVLGILLVTLTCRANISIPTQCTLFV